MKILSWNINGWKSWSASDSVQWVLAEDPDILCLQEIRSEIVPHKFRFLKHYHVYQSLHKKNGYAGVAVFSKRTPRKILHLNKFASLGEGRVLALDFGSWFLINVYSPNTPREPNKIAYRKEFDKGLTEFISDLPDNIPVFVAGDLNVAFSDYDVGTRYPSQTFPACSHEERRGFKNLVSKGLVDIFQDNLQDKLRTWWPYGKKGQDEYGLRLDYLLVSNAIVDKVLFAKIHDDIDGSDHCPLSITIDGLTIAKGKKKYFQDTFF